jgi:hypothetical protein
MKHQVAQHSARRRRLRKGGPHSPRDRLFEQRSSRCRGTPLLVPKSRLDAVKRVTREAARAFTVGDPPDPKTAVGPMVSQKQYGRVQSYIHKGIEEGAPVKRERPPCISRHSRKSSSGAFAVLERMSLNCRRFGGPPYVCNPVAGRTRCSRCSSCSGHQMLPRFTKAKACRV